MKKLEKIADLLEKTIYVVLSVTTLVLIVLSIIGMITNF